MILVTRSQYKGIEQDGIRLVEPTNPYPDGMLGRAKRALAARFGLATILCFNNELKKSDGETILVFDHVASIPLMKQLHRHNPNSRLILWYWRPVADTIDPNKVPPYFEKWTYSKSDAKRFNMRFNTQFIPDLDAIIEAQKDFPEPKIDFCFVGRSKTRDAEVQNLFRQLEESGFSVCLKISGNRGHTLSGKVRKDAPIPYAEYLRLEASARCLVDICNHETSGLSLRPIEAALLNRKLLTNCLEATEEGSLFASNALLLSDNLDKCALHAFLNKGLVDNRQEIRNYYSIGAWARRFQ